MDANFWHQKWKRGEIAFHEGEANRFLTDHFDKLNLAPGSRIFLPLCGKTRDAAWLLARGCRVIGAELSEIAIIELFAELGLQPAVSKAGTLTRYSNMDIDILVGDIFDVTAEFLGPVDSIYDRAALVALPARMREQYTSHLMAITDTAPQLLISYEYNQQLIDGPPFSVSEDELKQHYGATYRLQSLECRNVAGGLKGKVASTETAWLLRKAEKWER